MNPNSKIWKWVATAMVVFILCGAGFMINHSQTMPWEHPNRLSGKLDTIEVYHIDWACDCAEWGILGEIIPEDGLLEDYAIFIEAAPGVTKYEDATLPNNCWPHKLKLIGQFYADKGISRDYETMHEKPEHARVFRYDSYQVLEERCPPQYLDDGLSILVDDYAYGLNDQLDTIEVENINWACDCAEWRIVGEDFPEDSLVSYAIFIEAAEESLKYEDAPLPEGAWYGNLKLIGRFYEGKGISRDYKATVEKPDPARVFRYDSYEITHYMRP